MEEFAALSGVSRPTVSKYFNDRDSVRPSTREKIERALENCDYRPNIFAINQNRKLTKNVGIVVPYLADPFFAEIARRIETLVIDAGFRPILLSSHGDAALEVGNLNSLRSIKPAGVLLAPLGRASDRAAIEAFCSDVPTVNFDSNIDGAGEAFVGHNNAQATEIMLEYLTRTGESPVFFEMRTPPNPNANKRRNAYVETMERLGQMATRTVFCSNDRLAIGFLAAAYEMGLRVGLGDDCALRVAGHDNHPFSRFTCPTLTTVSHNYGAIAQRSVETVLSLIETGRRGGDRNTTLFDGELIMRASA
jgi:DNA-binding LacI/PurR family transcriptional regulator